MELALFGGKPIRQAPYPAWPMFDDAERAALLRALEQGQWWRMGGKEVAAFEEEFAAYHEAPAALAVTNGTHALEVALMAHGIGPGDEVVVPAFTFISTAMAVQRVAATPIPADVDLDTFCLDPQSFESSLSHRTRAVIPVHMSGNAADLQAIGEIGDRRGVVVIQDAAHAHGMVTRGRPVGAHGTTACFSFQNFKLMTAGEGGIITFGDKVLRERAFLFHSCGRSATDRAYEHEVIGSNYRMGEFAAAVLREQLRRLPRQIELRERNAAILYRRLSEIEEVSIQERSAVTDVNPHYMLQFRVVRPDVAALDRNAIVKALVAEGVPAFVAYRPIYRTQAFSQPPSPPGDVDYWARSCPNCEKIHGEGIWIHHRALLGSEEDALDVARALEKVLAYDVRREAVA